MAQPTVQETPGTGSPVLMDFRSEPGVVIVSCDRCDVAVRVPAAAFREHAGEVLGFVGAHSRHVRPADAPP